MLFFWQFIALNYKLELAATENPPELAVFPVLSRNQGEAV